MSFHSRRPLIVAGPGQIEFSAMTRQIPVLPVPGNSRLNPGSSSGDLSWPWLVAATVVRQRQPALEDMAAAQAAHGPAEAADASASDSDDSDSDVLIGSVLRGNGNRNDGTPGTETLTQNQSFNGDSNEPHEAAAESMTMASESQSKAHPAPVRVRCRCVQHARSRLGCQLNASTAGSATRCCRS